ncbi:MAG TPA: efflux RND transporter periplasmic adaptor subunit [Vulgatibacter sp.]
MLPIALLLTSACQHKEKELRAYGTVEARQVDLGSRVTGKVLEVLVDEGYSVAAGQPLLRIDLSDLEAQRRQAIAALDVARAQERLVLAGARLEDIDAARKTWQASVAQANVSKQDYARTALLARQGAAARASAQDLRQSRDAAVKVAQADYAQFQKLLNGARIEEIDAAVANRVQAEEAVQVIDARLVDREIPSPLDGVVLLRLVEPGTVILPGMRLLQLGDVFHPYVDVYVPERRVGEVRLGGEVEVQIDGFPDWTFRGQVRFVSTEAEFTPKNVQTADERARLVFRTRVDVFDPEHRLKPGMPASVLFPNGR